MVQVERVQTHRHLLKVQHIPELILQVLPALIQEYIHRTEKVQDMLVLIQLFMLVLIQVVIEDNTQQHIQEVID